ncbi:MAG TPA: phenylalanine--tRNA ligase beta subunit-related protein [Dictyobacter sp.]|jgi:DNA/RNA-binding domain of Phe-tRNA-synthetase-like protein|nr:phenylalanine--tRNA ligase beta subunit-related protein [Dictyobacter sp.]
MSTFQYHPDILTRFPAVTGGIILAQGMTNGPTPEPLLTMYQAEQERVKTELENTALSELPTLSAWRSAFRKFDVNPTQYRCAAEALLRRLTKKGDIPSINALVDIGNLISIRYALPVAVFDTRSLQGPITVHFANGTERYTTLGESEAEHPAIGEVIFSDDTGLVVARRWCWRQSEQSAAQQDTTSAIFAIEAHHTNGPADVASALSTLQELLTTYIGGSFISGILDAHHQGIS